MNNYIPKSKRNGNGSGIKNKKIEKKEDSTFKSPNEMFKAAKDIMLEGREPTSKKDWELVVNFWATNIHPELASSGTKLLCRIYNVPISDENIEKIVQFQRKQKK